jgi:hypothetical protein
LKTLNIRWLYILVSKRISFPWTINRVKSPYIFMKVEQILSTMNY